MLFQSYIIKKTKALYSDPGVCVYISMNLHKKFLRFIIDVYCFQKKEACSRRYLLTTLINIFIRYKYII